jgi:hypothetical protein
VIEASTAAGGEKMVWSLADRPRFVLKIEKSRFGSTRGMSQGLNCILAKGAMVMVQLFAGLPLSLPEEVLRMENVLF